MIITCPRCFATYNVPDAALARGNLAVRCSSCKFEWHEAPPPASAIAAMAPDPALAGRAGTFMPSTIEDIPLAGRSHSPEPQQPEGPAPAAAPVRHKPAAIPAKAVVPKAPSQLGRNLLWGLAILVTLACLLALLREPLGRSSAAMADFYEKIGLPVEGPEDWFRFEGVRLEKSEQGSQLVFSVHGRIINQSRHERELPLLKLFWRSSRGSIGPMVVLKADTQSLAAGAATAFNGELKGVDASNGGEVKVTFLTDREAEFLKPGEVGDPAFRSAPPPVPAPPPAPDHGANPPSQEQHGDAHAENPAAH